MIQAHKSVQVMKRENKTEGPWLMVGTNEISCIILVIGVCNLKFKNVSYILSRTIQREFDLSYSVCIIYTYYMVNN